jgi:hypothetical protein
MRPELLTKAIIQNGFLGPSLRIGVTHCHVTKKGYATLVAAG